MKMSRLVGLPVLFASASIGQQIKTAASTNVNIMSAEPEKVREVLVRETMRLRPDVSAEMLRRNSNTYINTLPGVERSLAEKSCAGRTCSPAVLNQALLDFYVITLQRRDFGVIGPTDVGETVSNTSYVLVWSDPLEADFRLLQSSSPVWTDKTNKDRFIPKGDYRVHIEKTGYEAFDGPCSNRRNEGISCGAVLKKKN
jgi:hypothetical protein